VKNNKKATFQTNRQMQFFTVKIMGRLQNTASFNHLSVLSVVQFQVPSKIWLWGKNTVKSTCNLSGS